MILYSKIPKLKPEMNFVKDLGEGFQLSSMLLRGFGSYTVKRGRSSFATMRRRLRLRDLTDYDEHKRNNFCI